MILPFAIRASVVQKGRVSYANALFSFECARTGLHKSYKAY